LGGETGRSSVKTGRREERGVEEVGQQEVRQEATEAPGSDRDRDRPISCSVNSAIARPDLPGLVDGVVPAHFVRSSLRFHSHFPIHYALHVPEDPPLTLSIYL